VAFISSFCVVVSAWVLFGRDEEEDGPCWVGELV
jgi:hypothetical protein